MMDRLAVGHALSNRVFVATTAHTNLTYDITLLGLVSQPVHIICSVGGGTPVEQRELAVMLAVQPKKEAHCIALLLPP